MDYYVELKVSSLCRRKTHDRCKNRGSHCGCECHLVQRLNKEYKEQSLENLDIWLCKKWNEFWRPFKP